MMHVAVRSTATPQARVRNREAARAVFKWYGLSKLSMHRSQWQSLKPQARLRSCSEYAAKLCADAGKLGMPKANERKGREATYTRLRR